MVTMLQSSHVSIRGPCNIALVVINQCKSNDLSHITPLRTHKYTGYENDNVHFGKASSVLAHVGDMSPTGTLSNQSLCGSCMTVES